MMDYTWYISKGEHLWDTWQLRGAIILSLLLQTFLIIFGSSRKRTSSNWIITPLWLFYLLADWVASFAIGLIAKGKGNPRELLTGKTDDGTIAAAKDLLVFWAPFLLLHLGGPDTITAFALEDNELWLRHLLGLVLQFSATMYVFIQSFIQNNMLWAPTMLMIMNGTIKYTERTISFYLASSNRFKRSMLANVDPGMNYIGLKEDNFEMKEEKLDTENEMIHDPERDVNMDKKRDLTEIEVVQYAYDFFNMFKGLTVDLIFTRKTRNESREFFLNRTAKDAFKVVEVELNFLYEVLFTKFPVVYGLSGVCARIFSFLMVCTSIILFKIGDKSNFNIIDVKITYALLFGALTLDIIAMFMLLLSNKSIIFLSKLFKPGNTWTRILNAIVIRKVSGIPENPREEAQTHVSEPQTHVWPIRIFTRRWSESIPTYNLIYYCMHPRSRFKQYILENLGLTEFLDSYKYVKAKRYTTKLRDFIFEELKSKSEAADDLDTATEINSSRGDRVLRSVDGWSGLLPHTLDGDFGQRILLWHIATDLCYSKELSDKVKSKRHVSTNTDHREIAKLLSDYMMYLLVIKPTLMTTVNSIVQIQYWDLCANAKSNFGNEKAHEVNVVRKPMQGTKESEVDWEHLNACMKIFSCNELRLKNMKGDVTKSLLVYSIILANEVMKIEEEDNNLDKWLMISKVWVDLLCYGASHSQAQMQTAQVSKGGDLITIVWMLMAHFGLGDQFQIDQHQERARRVVD
ncbi:hypothetical protein CTI12_AA017230 [Artemisia annua]|uniref:DUF4220 domain-containing protein n=1 Tax=Artemisia annua TaxID=35608 RepID=A0A2U1QKR8_ARTAN|nr:hypothetical protein CTI12_AA017230 [Artemisia annua]